MNFEKNYDKKNLRLCRVDAFENPHCTCGCLTHGFWIPLQGGLASTARIIWLPAGTPSVLQKYRLFTNTAEVIKWQCTILVRRKQECAAKVLKKIQVPGQLVPGPFDPGFFAEGKILVAVAWESVTLLGMAGKDLSRKRERSSTPLDNYLREINDTPLLTADDEKRLAYKIQDGDTTARDHMVRANLRLVVNIARSFTGRGLDLADLIAEGNLGLIRAVEAFDPEMNTRFSTYASFWIRQSMKRAVINSGKTIRVPAYMAQLLSEWRRASATLNDELGRPPTEAEIAHKLKLSPKKLNIVKKASRIYQGAPQGKGDSEIANTELLVD